MPTEHEIIERIAAHCAHEEDVLGVPMHRRHLPPNVPTGDPFSIGDVMVGSARRRESGRRRHVGALAAGFVVVAVGTGALIVLWPDSDRHIAVVDSVVSDSQPGTATPSMTAEAEATAIPPTADTEAAVSPTAADTEPSSIPPTVPAPSWQVLDNGPLPNDILQLEFFGLDHQLLAWGPTGAFITDLDSPAWHPVSRPPIVLRGEPATAWTGTELVVWGGSDRAVGTPYSGAVYPDDGAAYNPSTDTWRLLPAAPIESRSPAITAWDGNELFVWGGWRDDGPVTSSTADHARRRQVPTSAAYNPTTDTWRTLTSTPPPAHIESTIESAGPIPLAWVDTPDATVAGWSSSNTLYRYDTASDTWAAVPKSPLTGWSPAANWTDAGFVALGQTLESVSAAAVGLEAAVWTTERGWQLLPAPPLDSPWVCQTDILAVAQTAVVRRCDGIAMLEDGTWAELPRITNSTRLIAVGPSLLSIDVNGVLQFLDFG